MTTLKRAWQGLTGATPGKAQAELGGRKVRPPQVMSLPFQAFWAVVSGTVEAQNRPRVRTSGDAMSPVWPSIPRNRWPTVWPASAS